MNLFRDYDETGMKLKQQPAQFIVPEINDK
jgi:hypothetical protein